MKEEYDGWVFILDANTYPKAKIIIKEREITKQIIPVKWEKRYEALSSIYQQYINKINEGERNGNRDN